MAIHSSIREAIRNKPTTPICIGCSQGADNSPPTKQYKLTYKRGGTDVFAYCDDCADLVRMDWTGEVARLEEVAG